MTKSATEVMQEVMFSAVAEAISALKDSSKGMPNILLRDIAAINANATYGDLPKEVQVAISNASRAAFIRFKKEGYSVSPDSMAVNLPRRSGSPKRSPNRRGA
jgi:hypothetical protein